MTLVQKVERTYVRWKNRDYKDVHEISTRCFVQYKAIVMLSGFLWCHDSEDSEKCKQTHSGHRGRTCMSMWALHWSQFSQCDENIRTLDNEVSLCLAATDCACMTHRWHWLSSVFCTYLKTALFWRAYETLPQCLGVVGDSLGSRHCCANIHLLTYLLTTPWSSQGRNTRTKCFIFITDKWRFGYIQRVKDFRRTKQVFQWISNEKRSRGLPRIAWWDIIWRDTEPMDTVWKDVCLKALDMDEWKEWAAWCASHWIWMD